MTTTPQRPAVPTAVSTVLRTAVGTARADGGASLSGLLAALWAVGAGLLCVTLPVLLIWTADGRSGSSAPEALRASAQIWLAAHGTSLSLPAGDFGLAPVGLLVLPLLLLKRAGGHAAELTDGSLGQAARLTAAVAGPYAAATAGVALASGSAAVQPNAVSALVSGALVALVGAGVGVLRSGGLGSAAWRALPAAIREVARPAAAAVSALLGAGAVLAGSSLAWHASQAGSLAGSTAPGAVGGVALLALSLAYVPVAVVWGAAWWAGPGFSVGVGTGVSPFGVTLGPVPAFPLLGALPATAPARWLAVLALLVPVLAGVMAGVVAQRSTVGTVSRPRLVAVGVTAGAAMAALSALCTGSLGGGRLAELGPLPWRVGLAVALSVSAGALSWQPGRQLAGSVRERLRR